MIKYEGSWRGSQNRHPALRPNMVISGEIRCNWESKDVLGGVYGFSLGQIDNLHLEDKKYVFLDDF